MSREAYSPPTLSQNNITSVGPTGPSGGAPQSANFNVAGVDGNFEDTSRPVAYLCGDCDSRVSLKRGDPIRCKECGYRVLYKERTTR